MRNETNSKYAALVVVLAGCTLVPPTEIADVQRQEYRPRAVAGSN